MTTTDAGARLVPDGSSSPEWLATLLANTLAISQGAGLNTPAGVLWGRDESAGSAGRPKVRPVPNWMAPTIQAFGGLRWYDDGLLDDARPTEPAAAAALLRLLAEILGPEAPVPSIVPTRRGGVQAEWHENGVYLEIEVDPDGSIEYYFADPGEEAEGSVFDNLADLTGYANRLSVHST